MPLHEYTPKCHVFLSIPDPFDMMSCIHLLVVWQAVCSQSSFAFFRRGIYPTIHHCHKHTALDTGARATDACITATINDLLHHRVESRYCLKSESVVVRAHARTLAFELVGLDVVQGH